MNNKIEYVEKIKVIECAETYGIQKASEYYKVSEHLVSKWLLNKESLREKNEKRAEYKRNYIKTKYAEGKLYLSGKKYKRTYKPFKKLLKNLKSNLRKKKIIHEVPTTKDLCILAYKQRLICSYSGIKLTRENMSIDHIIPLSKGGTSNINNLCIVDKRINLMKMSMSVKEFIDLCKIISAYNK